MLAPRSSDPTRPPGRPSDETLGPAIVDAVLDLLADVGFARLTLAAVAARAGVSTATIHRRWPTKRELVLAVAGHLADAVEPHVDTGSLEGDVRDVVEAKRRLFSGGAGAALVALVGESAHDPELAAVVRRSVLDPTREHLAAILAREAARGGESPDVDADAAARLIIGLVVANVALAPRRDTPGSPVDPAEVLPARDATLVLGALRSRRG